MDPNLAIVHGPKSPPLWHETLGTFIDKQATRFVNRSAAVFPWQSVRLSYRQLAERSKVLARAMLAMGLRHGDCVGIMAGNCYEYIEVFLGGSRIGCPVVVLNNTYTPEELANAVMSSCELSPLSIVIAFADEINSLQAGVYCTGDRCPEPTEPYSRPSRRCFCESSLA